jgi:hypothetical protein
MSTWYALAGAPPPDAFVAVDGDNQLRLGWRFAESVEPGRRQVLSARLGRLWAEFMETALESVGATDEEGKRVALRPRVESYWCDGPDCAAATTDREADGWLVEAAGDFCPACQEKTP